MCRQLNDGSLHRSRWDVCFQIIFPMLKVEMHKVNVILKVEYDLKQCAHIPCERGQKHLQNHLGQNSLVKAHTPYPRGHSKKDMMNEPRCT